MLIKYKPIFGYCVACFSSKMSSETYFSTLLNCITRSYVKSRLPYCFWTSRKQLKCIVVVVGFLPLKQKWMPFFSVFCGHVAPISIVLASLLHGQPSFMIRPSSSFFKSPKMTTVLCYTQCQPHSVTQRLFITKQNSQSEYCPPFVISLTR